MSFDPLVEFHAAEENNNVEMRAVAIARQIARGWQIPRRATWLEDFSAELLAFPGRHDDQVDALTQGLAWGRVKRGEVAIIPIKGMI